MQLVILDICICKRITVKKCLYSSSGQKTKTKNHMNPQSLYVGQYLCIHTRREQSTSVPLPKDWAGAIIFPSLNPLMLRCTTHYFTSNFRAPSCLFSLVYFAYCKIRSDAPISYFFLFTGVRITLNSSSCLTTAVTFFFFLHFNPFLSSAVT